MAEIVGSAVSFAEGFVDAVAEVAVVLDERARRLLLGAAARRIGRGGIMLVAEVSGASPDTVGRGAAELEAGVVADGRVRVRGGGRKSVEATDPGLWPALEKLVDPETRGDPMSELRWTTKSTVKLADELTARGHPVAPRTVARLLTGHDYSLRANTKTVEGKRHPDRDAQFRYINSRVGEFLTAGFPVISVDTKKKELVGNYKNAGREYQPAGEPEEVDTYDFPVPLGKVAPYGVFDLAGNSGWVNVGTDADTGQFAVESIRRWWNRMGRATYPEATKLLITADGGGSNGSRLRLWKTELAGFAAESGLQITVLHFPPGTSKWNRVEHRLFSAITMNWRGRPLQTHETIVETIAATTNKKGLTVQAALDTNTYEKGIKITDKEMRAFEARHLQRHSFHGDWNYTVRSDRQTDPGATHPQLPN
ncbi:MAG: ISAzo13 family transposase [Actinomycetota bacterium]|nr:ISAzo13 family transposase [Actinomycetota bacterium]